MYSKAVSVFYTFIPCGFMLEFEDYSVLFNLFFHDLFKRDNTNLKEKQQSTFSKYMIVIITVVLQT